ncbi:hypothetical protein LPJ61_005208 [Coemansia biformis]|uniref:Uncharacterized protein n=1 Tax=Coemansia biformis TaxID=1286918 RepID=A0A9W8CWI1_9FUNG|nr:hypothetical protein LPJ61_005208 [Coemansia biformis]
MTSSANDDDWADGSDGHRLLPWTGGNDKDGWVPDNDEDINGSNLQLPLCAKQYCMVQVVLCDLLQPSNFTDCQVEDAEIQSWIALCHQCEWLKDLLTPEFHVVKTKCLHGAVLYELVGRHGMHDVVGTWVPVLTCQAARWYVKVVHHALAHLGNMCTLKFIMQHVWCLSLHMIVQLVCGLCHTCQVSMIQMLNHMPMVMSQLHHLCEHLYINFLHVGHWGDEALGVLITVDSTSSYMQDAVPTEEQLAEWTFEQVRSH